METDKSGTCSQNGNGKSVHEESLEKQRKWFQTKKESLENREEYWGNVAENLTWNKKWDKVCDLSDAPFTRWFSGGEINMCYNCVDKHVEDGHGDEVVFLFDSPVTKTKRSYTYQEIYDQVTLVAGILKEYEVSKGDRVMICMPMMPDTVFGMLAASRLGAVHCVMPSGLPAQDLSVRIDHAKPKAILVASHGYHANGFVNYKEIVDEACSNANYKISKVLVYNRLEIGEKLSMVKGRDEDWQTKLKTVQPALQCVPMESNDPLFVIYTSGSTGEPKGIVHSIGGYAVNLFRDASQVFGTDEIYKDTLFGTSSLGWIAGQMILCHIPLLLKWKTVLFEGDPLLTEDVNVVYKLIEDNKITRAFLRPGILKFLKSSDPEGKIAAKHDISSLIEISAGGEVIDPTTMEWTVRVLGSPVMNLYAQTEMATAIAGTFWYPLDESEEKFRLGSLGYPGADVVIMKEDKTIAEPYEKGRILIRLPLPPGGLSTLLNDHEKCKTTYFTEYPGYYDTKDEGYLDDDHTLTIGGRVDDIMKHGSVYLAAQAVEEIVSTHPDVAENVVISIPHLVLKELPVTLYTTVKDCNRNPDIISEEILQKARDHFGEAVTFGKAILVKELPRTRTGKTHRPSLTALGKGQKQEKTGALENAEVLEEIATALKNAGY